MNREEHARRHKELHSAFDELLADYLSLTKKPLTNLTVPELIEWSYQQTTDPEEEEE